MKCPLCGNSTGIAIDIHSDGYAKDVLECTSCEALWAIDGDEFALLNKKVA